MRQSRLLQLLALLGTALFLIAAIFIFRHSSTLKVGQIFDSELLVQNTYLGPTSPVPGNPQLIRVEVSFRDSPELGNVEIQNASFNGVPIPLKPRDVYGFRGKGSFQLPPGKYKLNWTVNRSKSAWPRTVPHEEIVTLDPRDLWVEVDVVGEEASIR
jgi:hypothetical protein